MLEIADARLRDLGGLERIVEIGEAAAGQDEETTIARIGVFVWSATALDVPRRPPPRGDHRDTFVPSRVRARALTRAASLPRGQVSGSAARNPRGRAVDAPDRDGLRTLAGDLTADIHARREIGRVAGDQRERTDPR